MRRQTSGWVTCAKLSRNTDPSVSHTFSRRFFKTKLPKIHYRCSIENSWVKRTQFGDVLSESVIFQKLGFLWWKLKIFIANFSHVSPNQFWRIFSMLLNSHPTIKWRWKWLCCIYFDAQTQFDWTFKKAVKNRVQYHGENCNRGQFIALWNATF